MKIEQAISFEKYIAEKSAVQNGGLFMSVVLETEPKMNKTGNPYFGHVKKIQKIRGAAGFAYETLVNNRLEKEGKDAEFVAQAPRGRHHITRLITQSDKDMDTYYMNLFLLNDNYQCEVQYIDTITGEEIAKSELEPFFPKQSDAEQGGLDKKIKMIAPKIENIRELKCGEFQM